MPPDSAQDGIVGTGHDKRIPRNDVIGRAPWQARPLRRFRRDTEQRQRDAKSDKPSGEFLRRIDPHRSVQDDKQDLGK